MSYVVRYFLLIALFGTHAILQANNLSGYSFLTAQPFSTIPTDMTYSMIMDQYYENGSVLNKPQLQTTVFGGASVDSDNLAEYFLFNNKQVLNVVESVGNDVSSRQEIIGFNFNIFTQGENYASRIALNPRQTYWGIGVSGRWGFHERLWATFQIPFISVTNDLGLEEQELVAPAGGISSSLAFDGKFSTVGSMIEAFRQSDMLYGKIDGPRTKRGIGDIELTLGYDFEDRFDRYFAPYVGVTLPTSNKPTAEYVWEPVTGNNQHWGVFAGACGHSQIFEKQNGILWFTWSFKNQYLFSNIQKRSFDLYRGPWTRYLAMYKNNLDRISSVLSFGYTGIKTFGINLMTQDAYVEPGFSNTSTMSLSYTRNNFQATFGTSSFIRESEDVQLVQHWKQGPSVASFGADASTSYLRTIGTMCLEDGEVAQSVYITQEDINLNSAATANVIVGGLYGTLGYYADSDFPQLYEVGCLYETSAQNSAISRYAIWGKFQITF